MTQLDLSYEKLAKTVIITAVNDLIDYTDHKKPELRSIGMDAKQFLFGKESSWVESRHTWLEHAGYDPQWFEEKLSKAYPQYVRARGRGKPMKPEAMMDIKCPACQKTFTVYKSMHKWNPRRYCSRGCTRR